MDRICHRCNNILKLDEDYICNSCLRSLGWGISANAINDVKAKEMLTKNGYVVFEIKSNNIIYRKTIKKDVYSETYNCIEINTKDNTYIATKTHNDYFSSIYRTIPLSIDLELSSILTKYLNDLKEKK